jgi:ribose/xylose/arabinose/galactoside ABC-type transport system permease subunit
VTSTGIPDVGGFGSKWSDRLDGETGHEQRQLISLTSCLTSGLINGDPGRVIPVAVGVLALGTLVGVLNAGLVVSLRVHPLIVILGMGANLQGAAPSRFTNESY